ncbi:MAG: L-lysine 6-transaminase [Planctomycetota bacterium]
MMKTPPSEVHDALRRSMLVDGLPLVFDPEGCRGSRLRDGASGREFIDFFGFFASLPVGFNHPHLTDREWVSHLGRWAVHKPSNSDVYSAPFADFVRIFEEVALPAEMKHLFFISGGALAVENALKVAFDWKTRRNRAQGIDRDGDRVIHLRDAFHGRSGYTLSLTNTDPVKTDLFPKFDWPRVLNPWCAFPLEGENLDRTIERERESLAAIEGILREDAQSVACILLEPIQCEGGDHHFRGEYLQGLRKLAEEHDVLLVFDEVQTGLGITGEMWCYQHFGTAPDLLAFGKKTQVCGVMAGARIDEVKENVFAVSSRINSTWGGNLVDMIRATRILEIYRDEDILGNARARGEQLRTGLARLAADFPGRIEMVRGRGLLVAFDTQNTADRDRLIADAFERGLLLLSCGPRSVRFRPVLDIDEGTIEEGLALLEQVLQRV